jgi:hypothetical protein
MNSSITRNIAESCVTVIVDWQRKSIQENFSLKEYGNWEAAETAAREWMNSMLSKRSEFISNTSLAFWSVLTTCMFATLGYLGDVRSLYSMAIPIGLFAYLSCLLFRKWWPNIMRKRPQTSHSARYFRDPVIIMRLLAALGLLIALVLEFLKKLEK